MINTLITGLRKEESYTEIERSVWVFAVSDRFSATRLVDRALNMGFVVGSVQANGWGYNVVIARDGFALDQVKWSSPGVFR